MSSNGNDLAHLVHDTRKTIKRSRAMARLLREETGADEFKRTNAALRDAGRRLAEDRDAEVMIATLAGLRVRHPDELALEQIDELLARMRSDAAGRPRSATEPAVLAAVAQMRREVLRWGLLEHPTDAVLGGLCTLYREGRRRYERAQRTGGSDPERLHDLRKRVKALYYALDMLGATRAGTTKKMAKQAESLGDVLGEEHDLWMLAGHLQGDERFARGTAAPTLLRVIERRRRRLRKRALKLGKRLYARKPKRFAARAEKALAS